MTRDGIIRVESNTTGHLLRDRPARFLVNGVITCFCNIPLASCAMHCSHVETDGMPQSIHVAHFRRQPQHAPAQAARSYFKETAANP